MNPLYRFIFLIAFLSTSVAFSNDNSAQAAEPLKPMGAWFGLYQTVTFTNEILWPLDLHAQVHYYAFDPELLDRYGAVLIGERSGRVKLSDQQLVSLEQWVHSGGLLIITGEEGLHLFGNEPPAWTGRSSWRAGALAASDDALEFATAPSAEPLTRGVDVDAMANAKAVGLGGAEQGISLISNGSRALVWKHDHGKGHVLYLGGALTPQFSKPRLYLDKGIDHELTPAALALWRNLIDAFQLPTRSDAISAWAEGRDEPMVAWDRYQTETPIGAAAYIQPWPSTEQERVQEIQMDMGRGERSWQSLFVTSLSGHDEVNVGVSELKSENGQVLSADSVRVFAQVAPPLAPVMDLDILTPDKGVSPYWLVDLPAVPPLGRDALAMEANRAYTFWLESHTGHQTPPGEYQGELVFSSEEGQSLLTLPIKLKVWPVREPGAAEMDFEVEHMIGTMPGGSFIDKREYLAYDRELLTKSIDGIARLGCNVVQDYGYINGVHGRRFARIRATGQPLVEAMKEDQSLLERSPLPELEFSDYANSYIDPAIEAGLTSFATNQLLTDFLAVDGRGSPAHAKLIEWYFGAFTRTLRERGYVNIYCKATDELSVEKMPAYIETAKIFQQAGYDLYTTAYNFMYDQDAASKAGPFLDMWQIEPMVDPWPETARRLWGESVSADDPMWHLHASSVWGNYIDYPRAVGWAVALSKAQGIHVHGYLRWKWNQYQGAMPGPDGIFPSVTTIMYANSVTGGRYLAQLLRLIEEAKAAGIDVSKTESMLRKTVGTTEGALLHIDLKPSHLAKRQGVDDVMLFDLDSINRDPEKNKQVKRRILEMTADLAAQTRLASTVRYADVTLVGATDLGVGKSRLLADIVAENAELVEPLTKWLADRVGIQATVIDQLSADAPLAVVAGTADSPMIMELAETLSPGAITPVYPRVGDYLILRLVTADGGQRIVVVGRDAPGVTRGVRALTQFFEVKDSIR